jgi:hypothetical protein
MTWDLMTGNVREMEKAYERWLIAQEIERERKERRDDEDNE